QAEVMNVRVGATLDGISGGGVHGDNGGAGPLLAALNRAINHATQNGTLVVSAAGNDGVNLNSRLVSVPAQSGNGMAVSATAPIGWGEEPGAGALELLAGDVNNRQRVI